MELEGKNELLEPAHKRRRDRGRCSKDARKRVNSKKRTYHGNQYSKTKSKQENMHIPVSAKKVKKVKQQKKVAQLKAID